MATKTRRSQAPAVRRSQILEAARDVLSRQGYSEVLVDEVAARAGIAKGTIYLYFKDKRALYEAVMEEVLSGLTHAVRAAADTCERPMERLKAAFCATLDFTDRNKDFFNSCGKPRAELQGSRAVPPSRAQFREFMEYVGREIQACVQSGGLRHHDTKQGAFFFLALCRMTMMKKLLFGEKEPMANATDTVMDLFVNGLGAKS